MDTKKLGALLKAVDGSGVRHILIETKSAKVRILRAADATSKRDQAATVMAAPHLALTKSASPAAASSMIRPSASVAEKNDIVSTHVGFFSRFNPKTKKQYFKLRDVVKVGDVVGVVRAMHIDQEIVAEKSGKIVTFLVEEGQPVEYGQPTIRLE